MNSSNSSNGSNSSTTPSAPNTSSTPFVPDPGVIPLSSGPLPSIDTITADSEALKKQVEVLADKVGQLVAKYSSVPLSNSSKPAPNAAPTAGQSGQSGRSPMKLPYLSFNTPTPNEPWTLGNTYTVSWTVSDPDQFVADFGGGSGDGAELRVMQDAPAVNPLGGTSVGVYFLFSQLQDTFTVPADFPTGDYWVVLRSTAVEGKQIAQPITIAAAAGGARKKTRKAKAGRKQKISRRRR